MKYIALEKIRHNGVDYSEGDAIRDLTEEQAQRLFKLGVLELAEELMENGGTLVKTMSVAELKEYVAALTDPLEVDLLLSDELADEPRSTAVKLLEDRLKQLRGEE